MPTAAAILLFALMGPPIGFVIGIAGKSFTPGLLLGIPMSYLFAPVAASAGLLYIVLRIAYVKACGRPNIEFFASCLIGGIAGYLSIEIAGALFAYPTAPPSDFGRLVAAGCAAGAICGATLALLSQPRDSAGDSTLTFKNLHRSAMLEIDGTMKEPHGRCPSCRAVIQLSSDTCPACDARFGEMATWKVTALSAEELATCNLALAGGSERLAGPV
jgi:hypothetical protein